MQAMIRLAEAGWARRRDGNEIRGDRKLTDAVNAAMDLLDRGKTRLIRQHNEEDN
jgi:hypothetical protein